MYKEILFGPDARDKIKKGVNIVADAVVSTLGPRGQHVIFEESMYPTITKDGVSVAQQVYLEDKFENFGVMVSREAAENSNNEAGDGTTTTIVLLREMFNEGHKAVASGMNPILIKRGMDKALEKVLEKLEAQAKGIKTMKEKIQVATISANNDEATGKMIAEVIENVGINGVVNVTSSSGLDTEVEYVKGTQIKRGYESHVFINDAQKLQAKIENPAIIICIDPVTLQSQLIPIVQSLLSAGKKNMLLIADRIEGSALAFLIQNYAQGKFNCVPVRLPSFGDYNRDIIFDLAALTGATVLGEDVARKLEDGTAEDTGTCEEAIAGRYQTVLSGTKGDIKERIDGINALLEGEKDLFRRERLKDRLGMVNGSVAKIMVGGASESEQIERRYRIEDALNATKSAVEEGIVEGGGVALIKCSDFEIPSESKEFDTGVEIVRKALSSPLKQIADNGGWSGEAIVGRVIDKNKGFNALTGKYEDLFKAGIVDPKKVVRNEITNSVATAGILLTSNVAIANKPLDKKNV
jgi:chaperonin GroEL